MAADLGTSPVDNEVGLAPARKRPLWRNAVRHGVIIVVVVCVGYLAVVPLVYLAVGTFSDPSTALSLDAVERAYGDGQAAGLISRSLVFAVGATVFAIIVGTTLAFLTERTTIRFRGLIQLASLVPLVVPGLLYALAWVFLAGSETAPVNRLLSVLPTSPAFELFSMQGMIFIQGLEDVPLVFLLMAAAFRAMDGSLEEAAVAAGAPLRATVRRITLPLARPAILAAALLTLTRNLGTFEVPAMIGGPGRVSVLTSRIYDVLHRYPADYGQAGVYSVSLLLGTSLAIFAYSRLSRSGARYQTIGGKTRRRGRISLGRRQWVFSTLGLLYLLISFVVPMGMLVIVSFQPVIRRLTLDALKTSTLGNYRETLTNSDVLTGAWNSLMLSVGTATMVMLLTGIAAWVVVRSKAAGRWLIDATTFVPLAFPGLVIGVALIFTYLRIPVGVYGTLWILLIAYMTRFMAYGMRYASASMYSVGNELEESAYVSGATWLTTMRRVTLPLIRPGLVAGWIYVLVSAFRELSSTILLYPASTPILSVVMWQYWTEGTPTILASTGVLMITGLSVVVAFVYLVGGRLSEDVRTGGGV